MKYVLAALVLMSGYCAAAAQGTTAITCDQRARECRRVGLGGACTEPFRMATCRKTGIYTAPNGQAVDAKGR